MGMVFWILTCLDMMKSPENDFCRSMSSPTLKVRAGGELGVNPQK